MNVSDKVNIIISARDQFTGAFKRLGASLRRMSVAAQQVGTAFTAMGTALGGAMYKVLEITGTYDDQLRELAAKAQLAFDSKEVKMMAEEIRRLGKETSFSAVEVAKMFTILAAKNWNADDITRAGEQFLHFAGAMKAPLADAADTLAGTMAVFNDGADKSADKIDHFASVLYTATVGSSLTFEDLSAALKKIALSAEDVNHGLEGTVSMLMVMANVEKRNSIAGRQLVSAYTHLFSAEGRKGLEAFNIELDNGAGGVKRFADILKELDEELDARKIFGRADRLAASNKIFGAIGEQAMKALRTGLNSGELEKLEEDLYGVWDSSRRAYLVMEGGIAGGFRRVKSAFYEMILTMGDDMKRWVSAAGHGIIKMLGQISLWIKKDGVVGIKLLSAAIMTVVTGLGLLAVAIAGITTATLVGAFANVVGLLLSALPLCLLLGVALNEIWDALSGSNADQSMKSGIINTIKWLWNDVGDVIKEVMMLLARGEWEQALDVLADVFKVFAGKMMKMLKPLYEALKETFSYQMVAGTGGVLGSLKKATGVTIAGNAWVASNMIDRGLMQGRWAELDMKAWQDKYGKDAWNNEAYKNRWKEIDNQFWRDYDEWIGMDDYEAAKKSKAQGGTNDPILDMMNAYIEDGEDFDESMRQVREDNLKYEKAVDEIFKARELNADEAAKKEAEIRARFKGEKEARDLANLDRMIGAREQAAKEAKYEDMFGAPATDRANESKFNDLRRMNPDLVWDDNFKDSGIGLWVEKAKEVKRVIESIKFDKLGDFSGVGAAAKMNVKLNETQSKQLKELEKANFLLEQIKDKEIPAGGIFIQ